jgi:hypothetical protein
MRLPRLFREDSAGEKEQVYNLAAAIERESGHRLTATPGEDGIAVSDGRALHFVQPTEIDSAEALRLHLKFWLTGKLEPSEAVNEAERSLQSEGARPSGQLASAPAISGDRGNTVRTEELTPDAVAGAQPKSSQDIGSKKGPLDVSSAKRTLEHNSGDLQGPGRKTTETEVTEKTSVEPEDKRISPQSRQAHFPPRYLVKETLKELEHEL